MVFWVSLAQTVEPLEAPEVRDFFLHLDQSEPSFQWLRHGVKVPANQNTETPPLGIKGAASEQSSSHFIAGHRKLNISSPPGSWRRWQRWTVDFSLLLVALGLGGLLLVAPVNVGLGGLLLVALWQLWPP